ncbi:MAG TPA: dephospho-CoA kinase, partial [Burkholderiaceae bacterium]|nr:dephospho-CoA kinase [Burkholderiaceae bacterium]
MFVVGLTGGIGSGKSTVAALFAEFGIEAVDADQLSRDVVEPGSPALATIAEHFGAEFIDDSGALKRGDLRQRVFADPGARRWLEALLHPLIAERMVQQLNRCASPYCLLVSPLLLETEQHRLVQRILVVDVSEQTQLARTLERDDSDAQTVQAIIAAQLGREERLARADDVLDNEVSPEKLREAIAAL